MLELNTRYVLRNPENIEKVISIKTEEDQAFYSAYLDKDGYSFTKVVVHAMRQECESCSA